MSSSTITATRIVVERYDEALKQIAHLKRENLALKEIIRVNEIKTMNLIEHYNTEIDTQTKLAIELKEELRARERLEVLKRHRNYRDQGTWIEEEELQSKENELVAVIYLLEDEIQALKDDQQKRSRNFERKAIENEANVKQSFLRDIDAFRSQLSSSVCDEVRGALTDTVCDNQRLALEFRLLLQEMDKIQVSRDEKDTELSRTKRELELLKHTHQLLVRKMKRQIPLESKTSETNDASASEEKPEAGSSLEDYFKKCMHIAQRAKSPTTINNDQC